MSKFDENMSNFFEVAPTNDFENLPATKDPIAHESLDIDLKKDYEIARENFHELIDKGKEAFDTILEISANSEKSRDYEVAAQIFKNVLDANQQMIDLHKKIREITNYKQESEEKTTIKNALFVGSTTELSKLLKGLNEKEIN